MDLIKACKQLVIKEPFYGMVLLALNKHYSEDDCTTMCIRKRGINFELVINPKWWETLTGEQQLAALKHQLIHICFKHMIMAKSFPNKKAFYYACDLEVNSYISDLPKKSATPKNWGVVPMRGVKFYYQHLTTAYSKDFEEAEDLDTHKFWEEFENIDAATATLLENQIHYIIKSVATEIIRKRGTVPTECGELVENLFKKDPPIFNWRAYFRRLVGNACDFYLKKSRRKPSRRFEGVAGVKTKHKHNILVAIDTSGSVSTLELREFLNEIYHIYSAGTSVDIIECDVAIRRTYPFKGHFDGKISGRGGTDFKPVIDYYNNSRKEYSTLIYFTDGYAPIDTFKVMKQMIWVITSNGNKHNKYPGYSLFIPNHDGIK